MKLPRDFKEFLGLFNAKGVEYMIVGSYALAYYGAPRYTGDIDVFVRRTEDNARRIMEASIHVCRVSQKTPNVERVTLNFEVGRSTFRVRRF